LNKDPLTHHFSRLKGHVADVPGCSSVPQSYSTREC